jgi:hypothetical protein
MPELLEPGTHFGSPWDTCVQLALNQGWDPDDRTDLERLVQRVNTHMGMSLISLDEYEILSDAHNDAEEWLNDHCVPEGYWFGHHPDLGDMGVWEMEEE